MAKLFRTIAAVMIALLAVTLATPGVVEARKAKGGGAAKSGGGGGGINEKKLGELMGEFRFGMTREQVLRTVQAQITKRYDKKIFATSDVYQQDKLRRERDQEIEVLKNSYIEFKGKNSGWDVSIIDDQFTHNTGESMMVYWEADRERNQRRFFFFLDGKLYKMVITLDAGAIEKSQRNFELFRKNLDSQYGPSRPGEGNVSWLTNKYFVIAIDKLTHYDTVCLSIGDPTISRQIVKLRAQRQPKVEKKNPIIRSMLQGDADTPPDISQGADTIDRIIKEQ